MPSPHPRLAVLRRYRSAGREVNCSTCASPLVDWSFGEQNGMADEPFLLWDGEGLSLAGPSAAVIPNGFLVPTSAGWLLIDLNGAVTELGGGVMPETSIVTSPGGTLISFVANSQLIVSEVTNPGTPLMTLDLATGSAAGWAFAPSGEELVVTDGQHIVIFAIDGTIRAESELPENRLGAGPLWTTDGLYLAVDSGRQPVVLLLDPDRLAA
ncbi:MAG: hypothetical protein KatS3mg059_0288 [Thermomicrobiales bacterium]|nr:MAG: hypothetical protein KatS3mg059_0288 [Thermomicrobiales bacterium]